MSKLMHVHEIKIHALIAYRIIVGKTIYIANYLFRDQLLTEQDNDPVIGNAKTFIREDKKIPNGRLRRLRRHLRIGNDILTKSGGR